MKAEIIAVGTELLMGYVVNTNTSYIAQQLLDIGIGTYYQQIVGDNEERLNEALEIASHRSDIIILSGGIGPTRDDVTKFVLADFLGQTLIHDAVQLKKIEDYFSKDGRQMTPSDDRQALTFEDGMSFFNEVGLANGVGFVKTKEDSTKQYYIVLPGPPFEMEYMMMHSVKPYLDQVVRDETVIESMYLNFYGLGEARLAQVIDDLVMNQVNPTVAIYARPRIATVRLTANALTTQAAQGKNLMLSQTILKRLEDYFIGYGAEHSFDAYMIELIHQAGKTLSVAESLTGGLVMEHLTRVPGSSAVIKGGVVTYQTQMKTDLLGVDSDIIAKYSVISSECAEAMAEKCLEISDSDFALSLTGIAGPDSTKNHPVGEVYIGLAVKGQPTQTKALRLGFRPRQVIREIAKNEALNLLRKYLIG